MPKRRKNDVPRPKSLKVISDEEHRQRAPKAEGAHRAREEHRMKLQAAYDKGRSRGGMK